MKNRAEVQNQEQKGQGFKEELISRWIINENGNGPREGTHMEKKNVSKKRKLQLM